MLVTLQRHFPKEFTILGHYSDSRFCPVAVTLATFPKSTLKLSGCPLLITAGHCARFFDKELEYLGLCSELNQAAANM